MKKQIHLYLQFTYPSACEYLCIKDLLPLWSQVVLDAVDGSFEGDATDEQDGENDVGERGREIHHLDTRTER